MKRIAILIFVLLIGKFSFSQAYYKMFSVRKNNNNPIVYKLLEGIGWYPPVTTLYPVNQFLGSTTTLVTSRGGFTATQTFILPAYNDTGSANSNNPYTSSYPASIIWSTSDSSIYVLKKTASGQYWFRIASSGSGPTGGSWAVGGNLFPVTVTPAFKLGTLAPYGGAIGLTTQGVIRAIVPDIGFTLSNDTTANKVFTLNPTTKEWGIANWNNGGSTTTPGLQDVISVSSDVTGFDNTIFNTNNDWFKIQKNVASGSAGSIAAVWGETNISGTANPGSPEAGRFDLNITGTGTIGGGNASGIVTKLTVGAGKNIGVYSGIHMDVLSFPATSTANFIEGLAVDQWSNAGTINNAYGLFYGGVVNTGGGTIGNNFGLFIDALATGTSSTTAIQTTNGNIIFGALPTGASTDSILTYEASTGIVRKRNSASLSAGSVPISGLTAATGTNTIDNTTFGQTWNWTGSTSNGLTINSNSTTSVAGARVVEIVASGVNATSSRTTHALYGINGHSGTSSTNIGIRGGSSSAVTNIGGYFSSTGSATTNYGAQFLATDATTNNAIEITAGALTLNGSAGTSGQVLTTQGPNTLPTWTTPSAGGSPAGNFGNVQINRNGAFATPGSDSLDFDAGLMIKGSLSSTSGGGLGSGIIATATGAASYASIDYINDAATRFQTGLYGSGAATPNKAFFFQAAANSIGFFINSLETFTLAGDRRVGIRNASPAASLDLPAGLTTAGFAPLKFTDGTLLTTAEAGAKELQTSFYSTKVSGLRYAEGGVIADFYTDAQNSGTGETDLYSYTTPASTVAATGEKITAQFAFTLNDLTATATIKVYFAGTAIFNSGALTVSATGGGNVNVLIIRTGASTARSLVTAQTPGASTATYTVETDLTGLTFTNTNIIKITGQAGGGTGGSNDITGKMGTIFHYGAAAN